MIYIDPPYNTGKDFIYNDKYNQSQDEYVESSGQYDEDGHQLVIASKRTEEFNKPNNKTPDYRIISGSRVYF